MNKNQLAKQKFRIRREFQDILQSHPLYYGVEQNIKLGSNTLAGGESIFLVLILRKLSSEIAITKTSVEEVQKEKGKHFEEVCFIFVKM